MVRQDRSENHCHVRLYTDSVNLKNEFGINAEAAINDNG